MVRTFIREKKIFCGDHYREVDIFGYTTAQKNAAARGKRSKKVQESEPKQKNLNDKNARRYFVQLGNLNFGDDPEALHVTATYSAKHLPRTVEAAEKEVSNYLRRVAYARKKEGLPPLKYILVTAYTTARNSGKPTRIHHHIVMNGGLAELFKDVYRLEPEAARTTIRFTLSIERDTATVIPAGTRLSAGEEIVFATIAALTIPAGRLTGEVAAVCQTAGEIGNGFIPGQITKLVDIFPYYEKAENITESAGGADWESDATFYARIRESMETFSTAGPLGGYEYYAKSASALIVDVKATSPEPGEVDVRVLLAGGELPGEEALKAVSEVLSADKVRPLTDHVTVAAPETVPYNIDVTYYTQTGGALGPEMVAQNVAAAVAEYQRWQAAKMGRDVNPSYLTSLLMQTGAKRVEVRSPVFAPVADNAVAVIGETEVLNGGAERE